LNSFKIKWRLAATTLSYVSVVLLLAFIRMEFFDAVFEFSVITPFITITSLVIGFTLASVMVDYREGKQLPTEISCSIRAIDDCIRAESSSMSGEDFSNLQKRNFTLCESVLKFVQNNESIDGSYNALQILIESSTSTTFNRNILRHIDSLRRNLTKLDVIRRTGFIRLGYALVELIVFITLGLLIFTHFENSTVCYSVIGLISWIYMYIVKLIEGLDHPFSYKIDGSVEGLAVTYYPITDTLKQLKKHEI
jgi:hypothetical protein